MAKSGVETDKSIALRVSPKHFVVVPKRDIRDIGTLAQGDEPCSAHTGAITLFGTALVAAGLKIETAYVIAAVPAVIGGIAIALVRARPQSAVAYA